MLSTVEAREAENAELRLIFARTFIEPVIKDASNDESAEGLLPNHIFLIGCPAQLIALYKCRKTAHSWGIAAKAVCKAATQPKSTVIIGSYDETEAREKLTFMDWIYKAICDKHPALLRELKMSDGSEFRYWANGSRTRFIARKAPTGAGASSELDEFSVEKQGAVTASEMLVAALGATTHTGQVSLGGTPRGPETTLHKIMTGDAEKELAENPVYANLPKSAKRTWVTREFPWWASPALCKNVELAKQMAPQMPTNKRVELFGNDKLIAQYISYCTTYGLGEEMFQREFECIVLDDKESYFTRALLGMGYSLAGPKSEYWFKFDEVEGWRYGQQVNPLQKAKQHIDALAIAIKLMPSLRGEYGMTFDVGRSRDHDELFIGQLADVAPILYPRINIGCDKLPFPGKEEIIRYALNTLPITRGYIDATKGGAGVALADHLVQYGQRAAPFEFTLGNKQILASGMKARLENNRLALPHCTDEYPVLEAQILRVKKIETPSGNILFDVTRTADGHGDKFWSLAMMCELFGHELLWQPSPSSAGVQSRSGVRPQLGRGVTARLASPRR